MLIPVPYVARRLGHVEARRRLRVVGLPALEDGRRGGRPRWSHFVIFLVIFLVIFHVIFLSIVITYITVNATIATADLVPAH